MKRLRVLSVLCCAILAAAMSNLSAFLHSHRKYKAVFLQLPNFRSHRADLASVHGQLRIINALAREILALDRHRREYSAASAVNVLP